MGKRWQSGEGRERFSERSEVVAGGRGARRFAGQSLGRARTVGKRGTRLRVIAGKLKGREIAWPGARGTHPMGAREKNALCNMIAAELPGARVLDAYAGSGALGIEVLSRGAAEVDFVEKNAAVRRVLERNLADLGLGEVGHVVGAKVEDWVGEGERPAKTTTEGETMPIEAATTGGTMPAGAKAGAGATGGYDVILADPPYEAVDWEVVAKLAERLRPGGILALSHPAGKKAGADGQGWPAGLEVVTTRRYAGAQITIFRAKKIR